MHTFSMCRCTDVYISEEPETYTSIIDKTPLSTPLLVNDNKLYNIKYLVKN